MQLLLDRLSDLERVEVLDLARRMGARDNDAIFGVLLAFDQAGRRLLAGVKKADQIPERLKAEVDHAAALIRAAAEDEVRRIRESTREVEAEISRDLAAGVVDVADRIAGAQAKAEVARRRAGAYLSALGLVAVAVTIGSLLADLQPAWFSKGFQAAAGSPALIRMAWGVLSMPAYLLIGTTAVALVLEWLAATGVNWVFRR